MAERKKHSKALLYFMKKDGKGASWNVCKMIILNKDRNTSDMLSHLSMHNGLKFQE